MDNNADSFISELCSSDFCSFHNICKFLACMGVLIAIGIACHCCAWLTRKHWMDEEDIERQNGNNRRVDKMELRKSPVYKVTV